MKLPSWRSLQRNVGEFVIFGKISLSSFPSLPSVKSFWLRLCHAAFSRGNSLWLRSKPRCSVHPSPFVRQSGYPGLSGSIRGQNLSCLCQIRISMVEHANEPPQYEPMSFVQ
jgi:hypothetical protein